ncbi:MAG: hypothetical protein RL385_3691, partial [Pseudomonadota bacterium]
MKTWLLRSACLVSLLQACGEGDGDENSWSVATDAAARGAVDDDADGAATPAVDDAEVPDDAALHDAAVGDAGPRDAALGDSAVAFGADGGGTTASTMSPHPEDAGDAGGASSPAPDGATVQTGSALPASAPVVSSTVEVVAFERSRAQHPIPVLLFQGGYASYNVGQLVKPIDIAYDVVEHPESWPVWRRTATGLEIEGSSGFVPFDYSYTCSALPRGTTLSGMFEYTSSTTIGTDAGVFEVERYRFAADGTYESCNMTQTVIVVSGT